VRAAGKIKSLAEEIGMGARQEPVAAQQLWGKWITSTWTLLDSELGDVPAKLTHLELDQVPEAESSPNRTRSLGLSVGKSRRANGLDDVGKSRVIFP
jgi:hypothetical protein